MQTNPSESDSTLDAGALVGRLRRTFDSGRTRPLAWRIAQLKALDAMLDERVDELLDALAADLGKPASEAMLLEIGPTRAEISHTLKHLERWTAPRRVPTASNLLPGSSKVVIEPLGVVLVLAPWNYPVQLVLTPLLGAIAAGNTVLVKPSEVAGHTSATLARLLAEYLDPEAITVVEGGVEDTTALLQQRFDHIFYTGNGTVGRIVMRAAAEHLTPVTLELGGKSPAYVDNSIDLAAAARRLAYGKFVNAGQTCVAPDYVLVTPDAHDEFVEHLGKVITTSFGVDPQHSKDYGRIISDKHFDRVAALLDDDGSATVAHGGAVDAATRYISPTVLTDLTADHRSMDEEIFGPVLPVLKVADHREAIDFINQRDKPLALYLFTENKEAREEVLDRTSSGGVGIGVTVFQLGIQDLPFGGVGESGMGRYHGQHSVDTFSHQRAVFDKPLVPDTLQVVYPPYTMLRKRLIKAVSPLRLRR